MDPATLTGSVLSSNTAAIQASADMTESNTERELSLAADSAEYNTAKSVAEVAAQQTQ
ncbi:MAG: hypothetical protein R3E93_05040 [Thiothrix sp.]